MLHNLLMDMFQIALIKPSPAPAVIKVCVESRTGVECVSPDLIIVGSRKRIRVYDSG